MKRFLEVVKYYSYQNKINCTYEIHIRMRFADRLRFLLYGKDCAFIFQDQYEFQKRKNAVDRFRKLREEQMQEGGQNG